MNVSRRQFLKGSALLSAMALCSPLVACGGSGSGGGDPKSKIVGTWSGSVNSGFGTKITVTYTFRQDGTVSADAQGAVIGTTGGGKWSVEDNTVTLTEDSGKTATMTLSSDGSYLSDSSGNKYDKR